MDAFDLARRTADKSVPQFTKYQHSSVILDRKGRIIATGNNHYAGQIILTGEEEKLNKTVHSEIHALTKVGVRKLQGATILNYARTNVAAILARPCPNCWETLKKFGFRKVFYTVRSDVTRPTWVEERF